MRRMPVADDSPADHAALKDSRPAAPAALKHRLGRATEPHILFPAIAIFALAGIWVPTLTLISVERAAAEHTAAALSRDLIETYEAQVLRAVRELDQALKVVKYAYELRGRHVVLQDLKARGLLPPDLLFTVAIADSKGDVVASTRPPAMANVADQDYFRSQLQADDFSAGVPRKRRVPGEWTVQFSRRLEAADGRFSGIVMVSVDAAYFVSVYDTRTLGEQGFLGLIGTDGVFRARRSGETVNAGDYLDYSTIVPASEDGETEATPAINSWDGVRRYTIARQLHRFPLAVIVGLSVDEQLLASRQEIRLHLWQAFAGSLLLLLVVATLGYLSRQLALSRQRSLEVQIANSARAEYHAHHDSLTALPNRSLFGTLLVHGISQAHRHDRKLAVLFLDLDRFKNINDTLGHEAGDHLLKEVAKRLKGCVRDSDTVARLGGDEFVVLLPELDEGKYAATVARKILSAVARPFVLLGQDFRVTTSVGISIYPQDGLDEQSLTKNADIAMYEAKNEGRNTFQFFSKELNTNSLERLSLESGLRQAAERGELQLHYQAKRDLRSGRITGMEALLRWQHPDLGTVAPMRFIPVAEDSGLIVPIGKWVLRTACLQNVAWQTLGLPRLSVAVNMSARQFSDEHLLADLTAILADTGMDAQLLELEVTESLLMRDVPKAMLILAGLKDMGIRIAIDNFGVGYSSLASLRQFPLDSIKIDRSVIRDLASVAENRDLARAILAMGRALSLSIVAQGVETKEQAAFLNENACVEFQGFYLDKPMPADQFAELLRGPPAAIAAS